MEIFKENDIMMRDLYGRTYHTNNNNNGNDFFVMIIVMIICFIALKIISNII